MDERHSILPTSAAAGPLTITTASGNTTSSPLNTTINCVPYASQLSNLIIPATPSRTVSTVLPPFVLQSLVLPTSPARPLNTTTGIPSTSSCVTAITADPCSTNSDLPSDSKLSAASRVLHATSDVQSPLVQFKHQRTHSTSEILSKAHILSSSSHDNFLTRLGIDPLGHNTLLPMGPPTGEL
ncbi:hypothetical protein E2C01_027082 [Portunus trituberculatus]|uniref:Uncharacterized protein n=1 Tax=Portunus trituberculatus TaxID=210409 RepID=A0A5B7EL05_PORTR|nr:hypothetical protein [Portunus trituberculatus]